MEFEQLNEEQVRTDIIESGRRLWVRQLVASNDGNISCRVNEGEVLITASGVSKGFLSPEDILRVDLAGNKLEGPPGKGPSSESPLHLRVYQERPDVRAVIHAHPPIASGFAVAGIALDRPILSEIVAVFGAIPLAPYALPGTEELPDSIMPFIERHNAFLLANHGAMAIGSHVMQAYYRMEVIEHVANVSLTARQLGNENLLSRQDIQRLLDSLNYE